MFRRVRIFRRLAAFHLAADKNVRACILDLLQKTAASPETFGDREPGKTSPRLSRSDAELLRRFHLVLYNSKMRPYPDPANAGVRSNTSLVVESVPQAFALNKQTMKPATHILGIDIAKLKFDVNLRTLVASDRRVVATFPNNTKGFKTLLRWLAKNAPCSKEQVHACMECTSRYGDALAEFLHAQGCLVSLVNPRRTRNYANSQLTRTVNDTIDARLIADFCASERQTLAIWEPLSPNHRQLRDLTRARQAFVEDHDRFSNMLETAAGMARRVFQKQSRQLKRQIEQMDKAIEEFIGSAPELQKQVALADSVPGVGLITAATVVAELPPISKIPQARQAVALFGLDPMKKTSGTSVDTRARLSRMGSRRGRRALYMPALVALRCNPLIRQLGQRLQQKGRSGKYVVVAAMRKLLRLIYGVIKQGQPFDSNWITSAATHSPPQPTIAA